MPTPVLSDEDLRATVEAVASHGSQNKAAQALGIARATLQPMPKRRLGCSHRPQSAFAAGKVCETYAAGWLTLFWPLVGGFSCCGNSVGFEPTAGGASPKSCQSRTVP